MLARRCLRLSPASRSLSTATTSTAEAREALDHVAEGERRKGLDRNRDGTLKLSFEIVGPKDAALVHQMLYATFYPGEPLIKHLGLCSGLNTIAEQDRLVEKRLPLNLTMVAYDETGRPVGAAVNNSCQRRDHNLTLEEELEGVEQSYRPIQAIHHQLRRDNDHVYDEIGIDKMFSIGMVGVAMTGQGIATNLIRRSILLAGCLGFRAIKAEATGKFSKETFQRVGMYPAGSIKYADFQYKGEKVFAGLADTDRKSVV